MRVLITLLFLYMVEYNLLVGNSFQEKNAITAINIVDTEGKKQGYWIIKGSMRPEAGYENESIIEEGNYTNNKKEGVWKKYFKTGQLKNQISYKSNMPNGAYKLFYDNGKVEEEGNWGLDKNTGSFKRYYSTGQVSQDFVFTESGKRNGTQKYYFENGTLNLEVEIKEGLENGKLKRYYSNGDLEEEMNFQNGKLDDKSLKTYSLKKPAVALKEEEAVVLKKSQPVASDRPNLNTFDGNGNTTLYNNNMQVTQIGEFKAGRLWNGKWKKYNKNGILVKIEIYKQGIYVGDAVIEEDDKK